MIKRPVPIILMSVFILLILGLWHAWPMMKMAFYPHRPIMPLQPIAVQATKAKPAKWAEQIEATGSLSAFNGIMVKSQAEGTITKIDFKDGQKVQQGDPLVQIYPNIIEAQLASAKAELKNAQLDYDRKAQLYKKNAVSKADLDTAQANLASDQAIVDQYQAQLNLRNIDAPFTGRLGLRQINLGEYVKAGDNIVNLQQLDPIRVDFSIPGSFLDDLAVGQTVRVVTSSQPNDIINGKVYALDSAVDENTRSIRIRAKIPNKHEKLLPGSYAVVTLISNKMRNIITVPMTAVGYSSAGNFVYVVEQNPDADKRETAPLIVKKVQVTTGQRQDNNIEVTSGITVGTQVVTDGLVKLFDGSPVLIVPDDAVNDPQKMQQFRQQLQDRQKAQQPQAKGQATDKKTTLTKTTHG